MIQRLHANRCLAALRFPSAWPGPFLRPGLALAAGSLLIIAGCSTNVTDGDISEVSIARAHDLGRSALKDDRGVLMLDTRSSTTFAQGHIPGARNLRLGDLADSRTLESLRRYDTLVVYGRDPGDSASKAVAKSLIAEKKLGKVYLFTGGIEAWKASGYAIETSP